MRIINEKLEETFFKAESNGELDINISTLLSGDLGVEFMINKKAKVKFDKVALYNIIDNLNKIYKTIKQWNRGNRTKILNEGNAISNKIGEAMFYLIDLTMDILRNQDLIKSLKNQL